MLNFQSMPDDIAKFWTSVLMKYLPLSEITIFGAPREFTNLFKASTQHFDVQSGTKSTGPNLEIQGSVQF